MGFLDNSGDIILDAVLTDTGRFRLAKGDGSFKIAKFAFGDDEIDYSQYDKDHPSGSAYYDLNIMQTPVLEAFTNNASSMKSKLMSLARNNLLYLPIVKLQESQGTTRFSSNNTFLVAVDSTTQTDIGYNGENTVAGVIFGQTLNLNNWIRLEQGLDTTEIPDSVSLDADLVETQYIIEMDNRFGKLASAVQNSTIASPSYIDDDNIASYYVSLANDPAYVSDSWDGKVNNTENAINVSGIRGPKGTRLNFMIASSLDLATNTYLFDTLGGDGFEPVAGKNCLFIDSNVRVIGATTGYTVDIPVRYIKRSS